MGDSTAMTIEFLRARLLSERSVSRTARQRSDQLAKRVTELEEQLRIMVIQRKKAEKAAAEVLSILENQGIGDFAEVIDSSSDQDDLDGRSVGNDAKEAGDSVISGMEKSEVEDGLSGSEHETSPSQGRSLSWKGRSNSPKSRERQKIKQIRQRQRHGSFSSDIESSGKHQLGKSCRKIGRRVTRSVVDDEVGNTLLDAHGEGGASQSNHSDDLPDITKEASRVDVEEMSPHASVAPSHDEQFKETGSDHYAKQTDNDEEMERVLEHQAQLIVQFQAEENAQREWEEKYNESKSSDLDFCEPGNQPVISETHGDLEEGTEFAAQNLYYAEEAKSGTENITNTDQPSSQILLNASATIVQRHAANQEKNGNNKEPSTQSLSNGFIHTDTDKIEGSSSQTFSNGMSHQQYYNIVVQDTEASSHEFAFPSQEFSNMSTYGKKNHGMSHGNTETGSQSNSSLHPHGNGFLESPSSGSPSSINSHNKFSKWRSPEKQNQLQRFLPQSPNNRLGNVLQALQRAKTSLGQLSGLPLPNQGTLATIASKDSHVQAIKHGGGSEIPIGTIGLFRLPMDPFPQDSFSMPKSYGSELSLTSSQLDIGYTTRYKESQYPTTFVESGSRLSVGRQYFDPYITHSRGMPLSREYSPPHLHMATERSPLQDGFSKSGMDVRNSVLPTEYQYPLYSSNSVLPDMRRL